MCGLGKRAGKNPEKVFSFTKPGEGGGSERVVKNQTAFMGLYLLFFACLGPLVVEC